MASILNVIICYKNYDEVVSYVEHLANLDKRDEVAVSIMINDDCPDSEEILNKRLSGLSIKVLVSNKHKNLGYLNGMIEAVNSFREAYKDDIKWIIMSNTDITIHDDFFDVFFSKDYEKDVWCIGPSVFVPLKKAFDNPVDYKRRSVAGINKIIWSHSIPGIRILYQRLSSLKRTVGQNKEPSSSYVYEVHGCFLLIRSEMFEEMLRRPYRVFMYSEEAYVSEIAYHNQKKVYYDADLKIDHNEHSVTGHMKYKRIAKCIAESMKFIKEEFYKKEDK